MIQCPADFPHPGSFALYQDPELPPHHRRAELVRVLSLGATVAALSFPLRTGASANRRVPIADLTDATALTRDEQAELAGLQRALRGTVRGRPAKLARVKALRDRAIWAVMLASERAKLAALVARERLAHERAA